MINEMLGGGAKNTPSSTSIDPQLSEFRNRLFDQGYDILDQDYQAYTGPRFADEASETRGYYNRVKQNLGMGDQTYQGAVDRTQQITGMGGPQLQYDSYLQGPQVSQYMNPYMQQVANPAMQSARDELQRNLAGISGSAAMQSGGGWNEAEALERGTARAQGSRQIGDLQANLLYRGYQDASQRQSQDRSRSDQFQFKGAGYDLESRGLGLRGAAQQSNLMDQYRAARAGDAMSMGRIGAMKEGRQQQDRDFAYQQFQEEQNHPYKQMAALQGLLNAPTGQDTETTVQDNSGTQLAGSLAMAAAMFFSDKKLKKNVRSARPRATTKQVDSFLNNLSAVRYEYANPSHGTGRRLGVLAQDMERSTLGREAVVETPAGKMIDIGKGLGIALAAQARLNEKLGAKRA